MPTVTIQHTQFDHKAAYCRINDGQFSKFPDEPPTSTMYVSIGFVNETIERIEEGFIWFDILKDIPKNCVIRNAKLRLFPSPVLSSRVDGIHKINIYELTENFPNNYVENQSAYPDFNQNVVDEVEVAQSAWMDFNVTSSVQKIVNGEIENYGWTLKPNPKTFPLGTGYKYYFILANKGEVGVLTKEMFPKLEITYVDAIITPTNLLPDNIKVQRNEPITCSWNYNGYDISDSQKSFDLQYKINSGEWQTISQTTSNPNYTFAADTFTASTVTWKVRTTDNNDITSLYSDEASFIVVDPPQKPTITNDATVTTAKPTITWTSANQKGYEVLIKDAD
jgi:hypothetical protein